MSFREERSATRNLNLWRRPRCLAFAPLRLLPPGAASANDMTHHSFPLNRESTLLSPGAREEESGLAPLAHWVRGWG